jgi:hypothetical protein
VVVVTDIDGEILYSACNCRIKDVGEINFVVEAVVKTVKVE